MIHAPRIFGDAGSEASTNALRIDLELRLQPMKEFEN